MPSAVRPPSHPARAVRGAGHPLLLALLVATAGCGRLPFLRPAPPPLPPAPVDTTPPPPDLSLPVDASIASDSATRGWLRRAALAYDAARHFAIDARRGAPLDARLARTIAQLARATTDSAREEALAPDPWLPIGLRQLEALPSPPPTWPLPDAWRRPRYPARAVRVASVIAVWSALRQGHAHRALADEDWDDALDRAIAGAIAAPDSIAWATVLRDQLAATSDSRVTLEDPTLDARLGAGTLPLDVRPVEGALVVTRVHAAAAGSGVAVGDEIERIDDDPIVRKLDAFERFVPASNVWARRRDLFALFLRGPIGSPATLQLRRVGARGRAEMRTATVVRVAPEGRERAPARPAATVVAPGVLQVDGAQFDGARLDSLRALDPAARPRALLLDLRGAEVDATWWRLLGWTLDGRETRSALFRRRQAACADCDRWVTEEWNARARPDSVGRLASRLVLLIDDRTAGDAEQAALQLVAAGGAVPVGAPSAGSVGPLATLALPGGFAVHYPWLEVRWPDGRQVQRVGLTPLVDARATIAGVRDGRDEVVEAALRWLAPPEPTRRR
jgi:hypothetical protein